MTTRIRKLINRRRRSKVERCMLPGCSGPARLTGDGLRYCSLEHAHAHRSRRCSGLGCRVAGEILRDAMLRGADSMVHVAAAACLPIAPKSNFASSKDDVCVECASISSRASRYGITESQLLAMVILADMRCEACGESGDPESPFGWVCVDHHHALHTNEIPCIRGVLCNRCNSRARDGVGPEAMMSRAVGTGDIAWERLADYVRERGWYDKKSGTFTTGLACGDRGLEPQPMSAVRAERLRYNLEWTSRMEPSSDWIVDALDSHWHRRRAAHRELMRRGLDSIVYSE